MDNKPEIKMALLERDVAALTERSAQQDKEIDQLEQKLADFKADEERREHKRLVWGVSTLGSVVMLFGSIIWSYRGVIFK